MNMEMIRRLKATHDQPASHVWVDIPKDIGWVSCPYCLLPFKPSGKLLYDNRTHNGVCEDCGEVGLAHLQGEKVEELELPF